MGAALGACLARHLIDNLNFEDLEVNVWSHSEIVLNWIASTKPLKKFVTNRISEIKGQAIHGGIVRQAKIQSTCLIKELSRIIYEQQIMVSWSRMGFE